MNPVEHFLFAMVPVALFVWVRRRRRPLGTTVLVVLVATQLPDAVDKPLAWTFGVLPSGRMLAHSVVVSVPLLAVGTVLAARRGYGGHAAVFAVAYLSHIAGDFYPVLWEGPSYYFYPNLFWPLLSANPDQAPSFGAHAPPLDRLVLSLTVFTLAVGYVAADLARTRRRG